MLEQIINILLGLANNIWLLIALGALTAIAIGLLERQSIASYARVLAIENTVGNVISGRDLCLPLCDLRAIATTNLESKPQVPEYRIALDFDLIPCGLAQVGTSLIRASIPSYEKGEHQ